MSSALYSHANIANTPIYHICVDYHLRLVITSSEPDVINSNPIKKALGAFQCLFESTRADLGVADSFNTVQVVFSTAAVGMAQILVGYLLLALRLPMRSNPHRYRGVQPPDYWPNLQSNYRDRIEKKK